SLVHSVHRRTDGNPLFVVQVAEQWVTQGALVPNPEGWSMRVAPEDIEASAPDGLREMIEQQIEEMSDDDRGILGAGGVTGQEFSAATVAQLVGVDPGAVEGRCDGLVQRALLLQRADSEDVDGTLDARYRFIHWVHQNVCYQRLDAGRRARLHLAVAEQQQEDAGLEGGEVAPQLARHFERGRGLAGAGTHLRPAARNARRTAAD